MKKQPKSKEDAITRIDNLVQGLSDEYEEEFGAPPHFTELSKIRDILLGQWCIEYSNEFERRGEQ